MSVYYNSHLTAIRALDGEPVPPLVAWQPGDLFLDATTGEVLANAYLAGGARAWVVLGGGSGDASDVRAAVGILAGQTSLAGHLTNLAASYPFAGLGPTPTVVDALNILNASVGDRQYTGGLLLDGESTTASLQALSDAIEGLAPIPPALPTDGVLGEQLRSLGPGPSVAWGVAPVQEVYVNGVAGSDANDGQTPATAWATLGRALAVANNSYGTIFRVNVRGATLDLGEDPTLQVPGGGSVNSVPVVIEGAWTQVGAPVAPTGGTAGNPFSATPTYATITTATAPAANAHRGRRVRFTGGALAGLAAMVEGNTAGGTFRLTTGLPGAPTALDTFVVEEAATTVTWTGGAAFVFEMLAGSGAAVGFRGLRFDPGFDGAVLRASGPLALLFEGCHLANGAGTTLLLATEGARLVAGGYTWTQYFRPATLPPLSGDVYSALGVVLTGTSPQAGAGGGVSLANSALISATLNISGSGTQLELNVSQLLAEAGGVAGIVLGLGARARLQNTVIAGATLRAAGAVTLQSGAELDVENAAIGGNAAGNAITASNRAAVNLKSVTGATAGLHGVQLDDGSHLRADTATVTLTGTLGDFQLGAAGSVTYATLGAGPIFQLPDGNAAFPGVP